MPLFLLFIAILSGCIMHTTEPPLTTPPPTFVAGPVCEAISSEAACTARVDCLSVVDPDGQFHCSSPPQSPTIPCQQLVGASQACADRVDCHAECNSDGAQVCVPIN